MTSLGAVYQLSSRETWQWSWVYLKHHLFWSISFLVKWLCKPTNYRFWSDINPYQTAFTLRKTHCVVWLLTSSVLICPNLMKKMGSQWLVKDMEQNMFYNFHMFVRLLVTKLTLKLFQLLFQDGSRTGVVLHFTYKDLSPYIMEKTLPFSNWREGKNVTFQGTFWCLFLKIHKTGQFFKISTKFQLSNTKSIIIVFCLGFEKLKKQLSVFFE